MYCGLAQVVEDWYNISGLYFVTEILKDKCIYNNFGKQEMKHEDLDMKKHQLKI